MDGVFSVTTNWANITWVATDTNYSTLLIHVRNGYAQPLPEAREEQNGAECHTKVWPTGLFQK